MMKQYWGILVLSGALMVIGCGKTESTSVVAFKWSTGQHESCVYAHQHIYCLLPENWPVDEKTKAVSWKRIAQIPYLAEENLSQIAEDATAETGTFDVKYSASPLDYSFWDCFKTGAGSPAMQCDLKRKPTQKEIAEATEDERKKKEQDVLATKAHYFLTKLTQESLVQLCGPGKKTSGLISETIAYTGKDGNLGYLFEYSTYGADKGSLHKIELHESKPVTWYGTSYIWKDDALKIVQAIPCLANQQK